MDLLTNTLRERLLANGRERGDPAPVVKIFSPVGAATWLFTELADDGDTLFGLCDLGFGCPELGSASLAELAGVRLPMGLALERDLAFRADYPLSVYAAAARFAGRITENSRDLARAVARAGSPPSAHGG